MTQTITFELVPMEVGADDELLTCVYCGFGRVDREFTVAGQGRRVMLGAHSKCVPDQSSRRKRKLTIKTENNVTTVSGETASGKSQFLANRVMEATAGSHSGPVFLVSSDSIYPSPLMSSRVALIRHHQIISLAEFLRIVGTNPNVRLLAIDDLHHLPDEDWTTLAERSKVIREWSAETGIPVIMSVRTKEL